MGAAMLASATVAGALVAQWSRDRLRLLLGTAAGALLVIAAYHLLPDAWRDARTAGLWPGTVPVVAVAALLGSAMTARFGCSCAADQEHAGGAAGAAALSGHRFLEGSALVLTGSPVVAVALAVHAFGEGLAVGALLSRRSQGRLVFWLGLMCGGPLAGAVVAALCRLPVVAGPLLTAVAVGILLQTALISLRAALGSLSRQSLVSGPAAAVLAAGVITGLAVHLAG